MIDLIPFILLLICLGAWIFSLAHWDGSKQCDGTDCDSCPFPPCETLSKPSRFTRKYLDDAGVKPDDRPDTWCQGDSRQAKWDEQLNTYGFDERETWSLDYSFYLWLYERLMMYKNINCIDLTYHKFTIDGETLNQGECIDRILEGCKLRMLKDDYTKEEWQKIRDVSKIWHEILPAMWW